MHHGVMLNPFNTPPQSLAGVQRSNFAILIWFPWDVTWTAIFIFLLGEPLLFNKWAPSQLMHPIDYDVIEDIIEITTLTLCPPCAVVPCQIRPGKNGHQVVSLEVFLQNLLIKTYRRISCRRSRHVLTQVPDRMLQVNSVLAEVQKCTHSWAKVPFSSNSSGTKISPLTSGVVLGFRCCKHRLAPTHQHISHEGWWSPPPAWRSASSWGISQARGHLDLLQEWDHHLGESALTSMLIPTIVLLHVLHQLPNHQRENTGWVFSPCAWKGLAWKQWYVFHPKSL